MTDLSSATAATINQLRQAFQLQKLYERDARSGICYSCHGGISRCLSVGWSISRCLCVCWSICLCICGGFSWCLSVC